MTAVTHFSVRPAEPADVTHIHSMIVELAVFEKLEHMVVATEELLHDGLFGARPACEAIIGEENGEVVAFALFFHNFSTFLTKKGLYLEDLYVRQSHRGKGYGTQLLSKLAQIAVERNCGRFEWSVLSAMSWTGGSACWTGWRTTRSTWPPSSTGRPNGGCWRATGAGTG